MVNASNSRQKPAAGSETNRRPAVSLSSPQVFPQNQFSFPINPYLRLRAESFSYGSQSLRRNSHKAEDFRKLPNPTRDFLLVRMISNLVDLLVKSIGSRTICFEHQRRGQGRQSKRRSNSYRKRAERGHHACTVIESQAFLVA